MDNPATEPARRQGALLLLAVFLLGLVCGASLLFLGQRSARVVRGGEPPPLGPGPERGPGHMLRALDLDEEQRERIFQIMGEDRKQIHGILEETRKEIRALLSPEQRERFDRMRPERPGFGRGRKGGRRDFRHGSPDGEAPPPEPPPAPPSPGG